MNSNEWMMLAGRGALVATALALASCGSGGSTDPASTPPTAAASRPITQSDLEIATTLYKGDARTPNDFYSEPTLSGHAYVATTHLKNSDVDASITNTQPLHELCTDDWNEALAWSETSAQSAATYTDLVETSDDARFHEFGRVRAGEPEFYLRARVFKCSYLDRATANLRNANGAAGNFKLRPLTAAELQRLSEYLWQFTEYNNFGNVVLKSSGAPTGTGLSHTLHMGQLARAGVNTSCDRIDVLSWRYSVDSTTGALELQVQTLWSFGARENVGVAELCSG